MAFQNNSSNEIGEMDFNLVFEKPNLTPDRKDIKIRVNKKRQHSGLPKSMLSHSEFVNALDKAEKIKNNGGTLRRKRNKHRSSQRKHISKKRKSKNTKKKTKSYRKRKQSRRKH